MQSIDFRKVLGDGFFSAEPVVAVAEQSALGSLNVPLTSPTVTRTTSFGEE